MSSSYSYSGYGQGKGTYPSRPSTSSTTSSGSSSLYAHSSQSSRGYGTTPVVIHNGGGQIKDINTSSTANGSYWTKKG